MHEFVQLFGGEEIPTFQHSHCEPWNHGEVLLQRRFDHLAEPVVVFDGLDLRNFAEGLEGLVVQLVYIREMAVGYHYVGKLLHVADTVRQTHGKLAAHIVGGIDDAFVVEVAAAEEDELRE
jgi:hypothetical protein